MSSRVIDHATAALDAAVTVVVLLSLPVAWLPSLAAGVVVYLVLVALFERHRRFLRCQGASQTPAVPSRETSPSRPGYARRVAGARRYQPIPRAYPAWTAGGPRLVRRYPRAEVRRHRIVT